MAEEALVGLLLTKIMVSENQLQFYGEANASPVATSDVQRLEFKIDATRNQIVSFIGALKAPSDQLLDILITATQLQESRVAAGKETQ